MAIVLHLDVLLAQRKVKSKELASYIGITEQNLSLLKSGKASGSWQCVRTLTRFGRK